MIMIQVRNLNGLQSSRQLFMRGAAGVNIMGQFVNVTAGGDATLTAGVREKGRERAREREGGRERAEEIPSYYTLLHM